MVVWWCGWRWRHVNQTLEGGEGSILKAEMKVTGSEHKGIQGPGRMV